MNMKSFAAALTGITIVTTLVLSVLIWIQHGALLGSWALFQTILVLTSLSAAGGAIQALSGRDGGDVRAEAPSQQPPRQPAGG